MKEIIILLAIITVTVAGCKTSQTLSSGSTSTSTQKETGHEKNYILAVILKAWRNTGDTNVNFEITSITKPEGKLKPGQNDNSGNDYAVTFVTGNKEPLATYYIQDPLNQRMEWADEDGRLNTTRLEKTEEHISVRTNYQPGMKNIIIKKLNGGNEIILPVKID